MKLVTRNYFIIIFFLLCGVQSFSINAIECRQLFENTNTIVNIQFGSEKMSKRNDAILKDNLRLAQNGYNNMYLAKYLNTGAQVVKINWSSEKKSKLAFSEFDEFYLPRHINLDHLSDTPFHRKELNEQTQFRNFLLETTNINKKNDIESGYEQYKENFYNLPGRLIESYTDTDIYKPENSTVTALLYDKINQELVYSESKWINPSYLVRRWVIMKLNKENKDFYVTEFKIKIVEGKDFSNRKHISISENQNLQWIEHRTEVVTLTQPLFLETDINQ